MYAGVIPHSVTPALRVVVKAPNALEAKVLRIRALTSFAGMCSPARTAKRAASGLLKPARAPVRAQSAKVVSAQLTVPFAARPGRGADRPAATP